MKLPEGQLYIPNAKVKTFHAYRWCRYLENESVEVPSGAVSELSGDLRAKFSALGKDFDLRCCSICSTKWKADLGTKVSIEAWDMYFLGQPAYQLSPEIGPKKKQVFHLFPECDPLAASKADVYLISGVDLRRLEKRTRGNSPPMEALCNNVQIGRICPVCEDRLWASRIKDTYKMDATDTEWEQFVDDWHDMWNVNAATLKDLTELAAGSPGFKPLIGEMEEQAKQRLFGTMIARRLGTKVSKWHIVQTTHARRKGSYAHVRRFRLVESIPTPHIIDLRGKPIEELTAMPPPKPSKEVPDKDMTGVRMPPGYELEVDEHGVPVPKTREEQFSDNMRDKSVRDLAPKKPKPAKKHARKPVNGDPTPAPETPPGDPPVLPEVNERKALPPDHMMLRGFAKGLFAIADRLQIMTSWEGAWFLQAVRNVNMMNLRASSKEGLFMVRSLYSDLFYDRIQKFREDPGDEPARNLIMCGAKLACIDMIIVEKELKDALSDQAQNEVFSGQSDLLRAENGSD